MLSSHQSYEDMEDRTLLNVSKDIWRYEAESGLPYPHKTDEMITYF